MQGGEPRDRARARKGRQGRAEEEGGGREERRSEGGEVAENKQNLTQGVRKNGLENFGSIEVSQGPGRFRKVREA